MKFGKVVQPESVDFTLPIDAEDTQRVLNKDKSNSFEAFVGCAKWNKNDFIQKESKMS